MTQVLHTEKTQPNDEVFCWKKTMKNVSRKNKCTLKDWYRQVENTRITLVKSLIP